MIYFVVHIANTSKFNLHRRLSIITTKFAYDLIKSMTGVGFIFNQVEKYHEHVKQTSLKSGKSTKEVCL